jgi:hypothetical protein
MTQTICRIFSVVSRTTLFIVGFDLLMIMFEDYYGYKREDIVMLTDDSTNPRLMPTRENMVRYL